MRYAYDLVALVAATCIIAGTVGYHLAKREKGPQCPSVPGSKVAVTVDSKQGQWCTYIPDGSQVDRRLSVRL
jgi:hypothetical protein